MQFSGLLGNEELKKRLAADLKTGRLSHCYLICGPEGSGKHLLARLLAAAMQCTDAAPPCLCCEPCRKVLSGVHPDVITVDDPEKKTVSVALARQARADVYIRPGEGKRKIYLFPRAQDLTPEAQNALLKVLEEPPEYGAFFLLADRAEAMLPTIRSRSVELHLQPVDEKTALPYLREKFPDKPDSALTDAHRRSGGRIGKALRLLEQDAAPDPLAQSLIAAYAQRDALAQARALSKLERCKREQMLPVLRQTRETFADALCEKSGGRSENTDSTQLPLRTAADLLQACRVLQEAIRAAEQNVGPGHVCGYLAAMLR